MASDVALPKGYSLDQLFREQTMACVCPEVVSILLSRGQQFSLTGLSMMLLLDFLLLFSFSRQGFSV